MPRIDPWQLIKCLAVLLTPSGGIRSKDEVQRLATLMMKFSKKLVSKCVYILILKKTDAELLGLFMSAGGWTLVFTWLQDGISGKNWALVTELLDLLLICPVDVERLKSNSIPRLVKGLSKDENLGGVNVLASRLVEQWLKIVKDETVPMERELVNNVVSKVNEVVIEVPVEQPQPETVEEVTVENTPTEQPIVNPIVHPIQNQVTISPQSFYKLTVRDGKQIIAKVEGIGADVTNVSSEEIVTQDVVVKTEIKDNQEEVVKSSSSSSSGSGSKDHRSKHDRSKHKSSSSSRSSSSNKDRTSNSSKDKDRERSRDKDREKSKSSSRDKDSRDKDSRSSGKDSKHKERDRDRDKDRDRHHRSNGAIKSSSSSGGSKEKQAEKDKATLAKIAPQSVDKLGKIPKKSSSDEKNKSKNQDKSTSETTAKDQNRSKVSISIEVRKGGGDRPKTVKVFHSKLRSTGLEEAAKPPPSRLAVKKPTAPLPTILPTKRPSPSREPPPLPEKRMKLPEPEEKPGGIKLIAPKPKPAFLQESDMFMDALAASATNKKDPKKRKRRPSVTKDTPTTAGSSTSPPTSPTQTTTSPLGSPLALKGITPPKFYKDTLETEEPKTPTEPEEPRTPVQEKEEEVAPQEEGPTENVVKEVDGLRGVLVYHRRRGTKKSVKWRSDSELEQIQLFELDETERVNVTKTFTDMKQMEHVGEREALQMSRKLPNEDLMEERTPWRMMIPIECTASLADPGKNSQEKEVQFAREKAILQVIYFNRSMVPDSPSEPDPENHQYTEPITIPLDDVSGNPDSINDFQNTPWPEPKGSPPHITTGIPPGSIGMASMAGVANTMFSGIQPQTQFISSQMPPGFVSSAFGGPNFMPPTGMGGAEWRMQDPHGVAPPDMNHGPVNPMFNRTDGYMMDETNGYQPQNYGPGPMPGPGPGPMFTNFPVGNRGNNRGGFRNMGRGGWFRPNGPPPGWHGPRGAAPNHWGGRGGGSGAGGGGVCKQFKMHGYCRQRDTCPFMHPQGSGPY